MNRTFLSCLLALPFLSLAPACDDAKEEKSESAKGEDGGASPNVPEAKGQPSAKQAGVPDPCSLMDEALLRKQLGLADDTKLEVGDELDANRFNENAKSCTWRFDGKMVGLQVTVEPAENEADTWASRMLEAKTAQGFEAVDGIADGAAFKAKESHLMFRQGESRLFSLSYAGDRPGATISLETLRPIAAAIERP
ncbi:MAG: hypothetical protein ACE37F_23885 [Nannocystaceae bacterium]|nr:hypothetical protein [bacterium]